MSQATGYSLWLVSESNSEIYQLLQNGISEISERYHTPLFQPHITLLGGFHDKEDELVAKTRLLAEKLNPLELEISDIGTNNKFFQQLFLTIAKTDGIITANKFAQQIFSLQNEVYFPHISLMYGDVDREVISNISEAYDTRRLIGKCFLADSIQLWSTEGEVKDWRHIMSTRLGM